MPVPALAPSGTKAIARFGGKALPSTGAVQSFIDLNDLGAWLLQDYQIGDSMRQIGAEQARWRGKGFYLSDDFGRGIGRTVRLVTEYYEGTNLGGSGNPIAQQLGLLSQAGEQYLTFDNKTYILSKYKGNTGRKLKYPSPPYWWALGLEFVCREPWARDFQPSGSLSNLLNPNGGFESAAVQPTLYGSTVVQSNDFETAPATVDYFHSIGTEALGTLAAWTTLNGVPTITGNVVTMPTNVAMRAGHADWGDGTYYIRFRWDTGTIPYVGIHSSGGTQGGASTNEVRCTVDGGTLYLVKDVAGAATIVASAACALTTGTWYWFKIVASGTTYSVQIFTDSPAGTMSAVQVGTTQSGTITDAALQNGPMLLGNQNTASASCLFGGAFANVCYVTGPAPTGCTTQPNNSPNGWAAAKEPAFCWSQKKAYYGAASLSIYQPIASSPASSWALPAVSITGSQQWNVWYQAGANNTTYLNDFGTGVVASNASAQASFAPLGAAYTRSATVNIGLGATTGAGGGGTVYFDYATIVQPNTPTGVLFNSLGAPLGGFTPTGTLAAWAVDNGAPSILSNIASFAGGAEARSGHSDAGDGTWWARIATRGGGTPCLKIHSNGTQNRIRAAFDGAGLILSKDVAGAYTSVASALYSIPAGSSFWLRLTAVGTTYTAYLYADAGGYVGDQLQTASATISDAVVQTGQAGLMNAAGGTVQFGGNYPGTFLVQGPLPTGVTLADVAGEPAFCWSKNAPHGGTYAMSVFNNDAGATGDVLESFTAAAASYAAAAFMKATGAGSASLSLAGAGSQSVTQDNTWRQSAAAVAALSAGASSVRMRMAGAGTAYFDDVVLQQAIDSQTGLYAQTFIDQVALGGSAGAGTTTTFTLTYAGSVWAEPLWRVTLPSTKGAAISSVTLVNQTTGVGLTFNFSTPLPAGSSQTLDIDCSALTAVIGTAQYDWSAPIGGGKTGFPVIFPGANTIAVTIVTSSGTATGCTLDTSFTNRWEM